MQRVRTLLVIISIFSGNTLAESSHFNRHNTLIVSGLDNVVVKKSLFFKYLTWLKNDESSPNGWVARLLHQGMNIPALSYYSQRIAEYLEKSYNLIEDTATIYQYLKEKGYPIVFVTNKNRSSYDILDAKLNLTDRADFIFVTKTNNQTTPLDSQQQTNAYLFDLLHKLSSTAHIDKIFTAPDKKPHQKYYAFVKNNIDPDKNLIFIDDTQISINNFTAIQNNGNTEHRGILFQNPLQLIHQCIQLGILSEEDDKEFIQKIELRHKMRQGKAVLLDILLFSLAATPSIVNGIENLIFLYDEQRVCQDIKNADADVTNFVKTTLLQTHNISIDNVKIGSNEYDMATTRKHIFISPDIANELSKALNGNNPINDPHIIDLCVAILQHEGNHIKNNDMMWQSFSQIILPFISDKCVMLLSRAAAYLPQQEKQSSYDQTDLIELFIVKSIRAGAGLALTKMLVQAFSRYCEQRADNGISNDVVLLDSIKTWLEVIKIMEEEKNTRNNFFPSTYFRWIKNFFETHPLLSVRIKKFEQRIALLRKNSA